MLYRDNALKISLLRDAEDCSKDGVDVKVWKRNSLRELFFNRTPLTSWMVHAPALSNPAEGCAKTDFRVEALDQTITRANVRW